MDKNGAYLFQMSMTETRVLIKSGLQFSNVMLPLVRNKTYF